MVFKNVFDPTYKPDTDDAKDLFLEQQKFSYSVLVHVLDTPKSTKFVKKHDETQNMQIYLRLIRKVLMPAS